jgi:hypothetical protein
MKHQRKPRFRVGQVVYSLRWLCYGLLTAHGARTLQEGPLWEMTNPLPSGIVHRKTITVVERELRPLTARERGPRPKEKK